MATIQSINIGASANDNTGDPLRTAFDKQNQNNTALNNAKAELANPVFTTDIVVNNIRVGIGTGSGINNTLVGNDSLLNNINGYYNSAFGHQSLFENTTGYYNSAIGMQTLRSNTQGYFNTAVGTGSLYSNIVGYSCTAIGVNAMFSNTNTYNSTALGHTAHVTDSNQVQLGNSATTTYVYGTVQNRSDLRDKADVKDTVLGLDFISKLRPVDYRWDMREDYKDEFPIQGELSDEDFKIQMDLWLENNKLSNLKQDGSKKRNRFHHGFIAQEVRDLGIDFGGFQDHSKNGGEDVLSIGYDEFIAPMIKAIQELKAEIELLKVK